jgi:hypothetical protein
VTSELSIDLALAKVGLWRRSWGMKMIKCAAVATITLTITGFFTAAHSQVPAQTPVRPLDGRISAVSPANSIGRSAGTTIRVLRDGQLLRTFVTTIPLKLPPDVLQRNGSSARLNLAATQSFVVDPDRGEWYVFADRRSGYSLSVEGDNRLITSSEGCTKPAERNVFLGSTSTPKSTITDHESGPKKEILIIADCIPYRAVLECDKDDGCDRLKKQLSNSYMSALVTSIELEVPEAFAPRALFQQSTGEQFASKPRPNGTATEFRYHAPGLTLVRQYAPPQNCGTAKGGEFLVNRRSPYSRLVFAGPDLMKRFPIVLDTMKTAVANSQIFAPGGSFLATADGRGRRLEDLKCDDGITFDKMMGNFDDADSEDPRNFTMPWADTFCEWRGNSYTQPFCAAAGAHAMMGPHYGADVRSWNSKMAEDVKIVSTSDGVVVEVDTQTQKDGVHQWEGFVVKIRTQHLIFVYRHMNPEKSPFRHDAHNNRLVIGDRVAAGQLIGYMGRFLGNPSGTTKHLHFEIEAPVPKAVLLGPACTSVINGNKVRVCTAREKAPPFPTLLVSYMAERYGETVDLSKIDALTGLPTLPPLPAHEMESQQKTQVSSR